jgi:hypothetical protein
VFVVVAVVAVVGSMVYVSGRLPAVLYVLYVLVLPLWLAEVSVLSGSSSCTCVCVCLFVCVCVYVCMCVCVEQYVKVWCM